MLVENDGKYQNMYDTFIFYYIRMFCKGGNISGGLIGEKCDVTVGDNKINIQI